MSAWKDPWLRKSKHRAFYILSNNLKLPAILKSLRRAFLWLQQSLDLPLRHPTQTDRSTNWDVRQKHPEKDHGQCGQAQGQTRRLVCCRPGADSSCLPTQKKKHLKKHTREDPLKVSYEPLETCRDHKSSVSYQVSLSLCLAAEDDQPQKLVCRIVGVELAAPVSYAQCQNGSSAHATNEDVVNPASDHGTENQENSQAPQMTWSETKTVSIQLCTSVQRCSWRGSVPGWFASPGTWITSTEPANHMFLAVPNVRYRGGCWNWKKNRTVTNIWCRQDCNEWFFI